MLYAQFYDYSTGYIAGTIPPQFGEPKLIEACGDRSVIIVDGRLGMDRIRAITKEECKVRSYKAFRLYKGESFTRSNAISEVEML